MTDIRISQERLEALIQYLNTNAEKNEKLFALPADEACKIINEDGYNFTPEELAVLVAELAKTFDPGNCELSEDSLNDISGGVSLRSIGRWFSIINGPIRPRF